MAFSLDLLGLGLIQVKFRRENFDNAWFVLIYRYQNTCKKIKCHRFYHLVKLLKYYR